MPSLQTLLVLSGSISAAVLLFRVISRRPVFKWNASAAGQGGGFGWYAIDALSITGFLVTSVIFLIRSHPATGFSILLITLCAIHIANLYLMYPPAVRRHLYHNENIAIVAASAIAGTIASAANAHGILTAPPHQKLVVPAIGVLMFIAGLGIAIHSNVLASSPKGLSGTTVDPRGMFRFVCCPIHFGVLVQWIGLAVASGTMASLLWLLYAASSIIPSAIAIHRWQKMTFPGFNTKRKVVIPLVL